MTLWPELLQLGGLSINSLCQLRTQQVSQQNAEGIDQHQPVALRADLVASFFFSLAISFNLI